MRRLILLALACAIGTASACSRPAGTLDAATEALGAATLQSIEYSGTGRWFQFGQAPSPTLPWPQFDVSSFTATVNYETPGARVQMTRTSDDRAGPHASRARRAAARAARERHVRVEPRAARPARHRQPRPQPQPQPAAVEERVMEIWTTPHGFLKAAAANNATSQPVEGGGSDVSFTADGHRYDGHASTHRTRSSACRRGSTTRCSVTRPSSSTYSDYRDFGGVMFPGRIVRTQGGYPVLDITVASVTANPTLDLAVPEAVTRVHAAGRRGHRRQAGQRRLLPERRQPPQPRHRPGRSHRRRRGAAERGAVGGGDRQGQGDSSRTSPSATWSTRTCTSTTRAGCARSWTRAPPWSRRHRISPYYEQAWAAPHTLNPDRLAKSKKSATFETVTGKHVLTDGKRSIEIHEITGSGHNDAFLLVYSTGGRRALPSRTPTRRQPPTRRRRRRRIRIR